MAGIHSLAPSQSEVTIDFVLKGLILWAIQVLFFRFSQRFLPPMIALGGVVWLDVLSGFSLSYVQGPSAAETMDLFNLLVLLAALLTLERHKTVLVALILCLGMLNRETPLILIPVVLLFDAWSRHGYKRTIVLSIIGIASYIFVRLLVHPAAGEWMTT